jgi:hypothetical protein
MLDANAFYTRQAEGLVFVPAIFGPGQGKKDSAMTDPAPSAVPLSILTGFLGSHQLTRRKVISAHAGDVEGTDQQDGPQ